MGAHHMQMPPINKDIPSLQKMRQEQTVQIHKNRPIDMEVEGKLG